MSDCRAHSSDELPLGTVVACAILVGAAIACGSYGCWVFRENVSWLRNAPLLAATVGAGSGLVLGILQLGWISMEESRTSALWRSAIALAVGFAFFALVHRFDLQSL